MNEEIKQKIINIIKNEQMSMKDLAEKLYISEYQLKILLKQWGVEAPSKKKYKKIPQPEREILVKLYNELGNTDKVAKHYDVGYNTVSRWLKELKIPTKKLTGSDPEKAAYLEEHIGLIDNIDI